MTQISWPWDTNPPEGGPGDGAAGFNEANARAFLAHLWAQDLETEGVFKGLGGALEGELAVSGAASPLEVQPGAAICYGLYISNDVETLAVATPAVGTTGGRVVLRTNWAGTSDGAVGEAETRLAVKLSNDGVADIPGLTQVAGTTWEISLATFTITTGGVITLTDDRTFRRVTGVVGTPELKDEAVTGEKVAPDALDDTKVGNRVPQFIRRQGGDASDWNVPGTTDWTPGMVIMQAGVIRFQFDEPGIDVKPVDFPVSFSDIPLVIVSARAGARGFVHAASISEDDCTIVVINNDHGSDITYDVMWLAIGPE